jgi:hypothetical protein
MSTRRDVSILAAGIARRPIAFFEIASPTHPDTPARHHFIAP